MTVDIVDQAGKAIDILGDQGEAVAQKRFHGSDGKVARIRCGGVADGCPVEVPLPDIVGALPEHGAGGHFLGMIGPAAHRPVALGAAKGGNPAFGGNTGAGQHRDA